MNTTYNNIANLISKGKTKEAIQFLRDYMISKKMDDDKLDILIIQESNLNWTKEQIRKGLIDFDRQGIDRNRINSVLLDLTREVTSKDNAKIKSKTKRVKLFLYLTFSLIIILIFIFHKLREEAQIYGKLENKFLNPIFIKVDSVANNPYTQNQERIDEYVALLQERAEVINADLSKHYDYVRIKNYLKVFNKLHLKNIEAVKKRNFILSHEITTRIHGLSRDLEVDEFWMEHDFERPGVVYDKPSIDAFRNGFIENVYLKGLEDYEIYNFID